MAVEPASKPRQIRRVEDLPADFSLAKYAGTEAFDIADWCINLERRSYCQFLLGRGRISPWITKKNPTVSASIRQEALPFITRLLNKPIVRREELEEGAGSKTIYSSHISDFTVGDCYFNAEEVRGDRYPKYGRALALHLKNGNVEGTDPLSDPLWKMYQSGGIDDESMVAVNVDLHGAEDKIVQDFTVWLRAIRAERAIDAPKKKATQQDFEEWSAYGILPYLDLTMWAEAQNTEITHQVLGSALFPSEFNVNLPERIRKVVRPLARSLSREVFTDALRGQALAYVAESKSGKTIPAKSHWSFIPD